MTSRSHPAARYRFGLTELNRHFLKQGSKAVAGLGPVLRFLVSVAENAPFMSHLRLSMDIYRIVRIAFFNQPNSDV
jgi:hypothetical protein